MLDLNAMLATLSPEERREFLGQASATDKALKAEERAAAKEAREAERAAKLEAVRKEREVHAPLLQAVVEEIVTSTPVKESPTSPWAGYTLAGVPVTVDGYTFTVKVVITDDTLVARRKAAQA